MNKIAKLNAVILGTAFTILCLGGVVYGLAFTTQTIKEEESENEN